MALNVHGQPQHTLHTNAHTHANSAKQSRQLIVHIFLGSKLVTRMAVRYQCIRSAP